MMDQVQSGSMEDWMWRRIIEKMYDPKDYEVLEARFAELIESKKAQRSKSVFGMSRSQLEGQLGLSGNKKLTREEMLQLMQNKDFDKLSYADFQKTILDFQLMEHEKFLFRFTQLFK